MKREARAVLLVLVGAALLHLSLFTDAYLRYVRTSLRPYLIASGVVLVALGLARTTAAVRVLLREGAAEAASAQKRGSRARHRGGSRPDGGPQQHDDDGHGHAHGGPRIAWLLLLPILTIFLVSPPALGSYTALHASNSVARPASAKSGFPALAAGDPLVLPLADFEVRAIWDTSQSLKGRRVRLTGFALPKRGGGWYLSRLTITCCAADAVTYKVEIQGVAAPPQGRWVEVIGVWQPNGQTGRDGAVPALAAAQATGIPAPRDPYE